MLTNLDPTVNELTADNSALATSMSTTSAGNTLKKIVRKPGVGKKLPPVGSSGGLMLVHGLSIKSIRLKSVYLRGQY